nr:MAG TPA: tail protein [Bacteriophage sp.]
MIKIYDINDKLLMQAEVTSAAKREQEMSKSDYISLSFSAAEKVILPAGAYINYTYKIDTVREVTRKFLLLESYEPIQSDECSWKYTPQFQHPKMILSKTPFFIYTRNSQNVEVKQNVWSFVGTTSALSGKIADFLNKDLMFGECGWKVIFQKVTANTINVSFSDNDFISALTAITNAIGDNCEWHIDYDDEIIYIGKVLVGAIPVILEVGKNVGVPSINESKEGYYNAFSIFGGTRNITQVNSKGENVSSGDIRLQLDEGNGTITIDGKECSYSIDKYSTLDLRADKTKEPLFVKVLDFSQIYPSLNTYVYNVRGRVKYVLDENKKKIPISYNADGSVKEYKTFTVWYMRLAYPTTEKVAGKTIINTTVDDGVTHYWYNFEVTDDLLINGKNIGCSFEANFNMGALSTPLAGRGTNGNYVGFELIYHKEASSSHTSDDVSKDNFSVLAGDYEIIYQEDNEVIIPTNKEEMLIPRGESEPSLKCNITVLYNIAMADTIYYEDAQNRLLEKSKKEIVRLLSDLNNYEVKSYSDVFLEENPQLQIGQSVTYKDGHGYELATRVLKLSTNIDYDFIQSITLGNQAIKGTITQLKEDVQTIIANGGNSGNGGGFSVSQLRSLIAKYGSDNFISKQFDDIAHGTITWEKVQKFMQGFFLGNNNEFSIDGSGNAILSSVLVNLLKSLDFNEAEQSGFAIKQRSDGKFQMLLTDLIVWGKAIFNTLLIRELSYVGGNIVLSPAAGKISYIKEVYSETTNELIGWKCYLLADDGTTATINSFKVDDQVRCKTFNIASGVYENVSNKDYWRLVTKVSAENEVITDSEGHELYDGKKFAWIQIAKDNCMEGSDNPAVGDTLVLMGNRSDKTRMHLLMMETEGDSAPRFTMYRGINSYSLKDKSIFDVGFDGINIVSKFFKLVNVSGEKIWTPIYLGDWKEGTEYEYYDQVSWHGTMWLCIVPEGQATTDEPTADSAYWKAMTEIIPVEIYFEHDFQQGFAYGREGEIRCKVYRGSEDLTSYVKKWKIERKSDDSVSDAAWLLRDKVKNFDGTISLICSQDVSVDDFGKGRKIIFTITAIGDDKEQLAQENLTFT